MRVCEVIGSVTLSRFHPSIGGARLLLAVPLGLQQLRANSPSQLPAEPLVVWDELGAGVGNRVGVSEGREAAMPFHPDRKPIDAYCACILDCVSVDESSKVT
jgi:ethanolamine utilization protein EutN